MKKIIEFAAVSDKEARLEEISGYLEQLKTSLAEPVSYTHLTLPTILRV